LMLVPTPATLLLAQESSRIRRSGGVIPLLHVEVSVLDHGLFDRPQFLGSTESEHQSPQH
ncbi:hypothetical protein, partial [Pseudomonas viridiflava]|uniref:hypothetical protein n=1 Tax=Pseudomonas viridiflava TaxID=33069 RepID=UPI00197F1355